MVDQQMMRASDRDRQQVVERLRSALEDGRLTMEEYVNRMEVAPRSPRSSATPAKPAAPSANPAGCTSAPPAWTTRATTRLRPGCACSPTRRCGARTTT